MTFYNIHPSIRLLFISLISQGHSKAGANQMLKSKSKMLKLKLK